MGRPALVNPILGKFARRFDCPVHGVRVIRLPEHRFRLELTPALDLPRDPDGQVNVAGAMQAMTAVVEAWVRETPGAMALDAPPLAGPGSPQPQRKVSSRRPGIRVD